MIPVAGSTRVVACTPDREAISEAVDTGSSALAAARARTRAVSLRSSTATQTDSTATIEAAHITNNGRTSANSTVD